MRPYQPRKALVNRPIRRFSALKRHGWSEYVATAMACVAAAHHGLPPRIWGYRSERGQSELNRSGENRCLHNSSRYSDWGSPLAPWIVGASRDPGRVKASRPSLQQSQWVLHGQRMTSLGMPTGARSRGRRKESQPWPSSQVTPSRCHRRGRRHQGSRPWTR